MKVLVTGGAGYIGTHACIELLCRGYEVVVADNFCNSHPDAAQRVRQISSKPVSLEIGDIGDRSFIRSVLDRHAPDAVLHFAGLKAVGDSLKLPLDYYGGNVGGTLTLLQEMNRVGIRRMIFSSSATVYGIPKALPITESHPLLPINPYGRTKAHIEQILQDLVMSDAEWSVAVLRYFNPVGAHPSGKIGEDPTGVPSNLFPYLSQVAIGKLPHLKVYGGDYPTRDGTGIRDYIHVVDLATGHVSALSHVLKNKGIHIFNLGTGIGYSVLEAIAAFEEQSGRKIKFKIVERREGDVAECYSSPQKANNDLMWKAECGLSEMCRDAWRWQSNNPNGFRQ